MDNQPVTHTCADAADAASVIRSHIASINPNTFFNNLFGKHKLVFGALFAKGMNDEFGLQDTLPWRSKEDLAFFSKVTAGCAVIMGRKTYDSLPKFSKPLPGRINIVVTSTPKQLYNGEHYSVPTLSAAIALARKLRKITWVIGGSALIADALPFCKLAVTSTIQYAGPHDIKAPTLPPFFEPLAMMKYDKIMIPGVIHLMWNNTTQSIT